MPEIDTKHLALERRIEALFQAHDQQLPHTLKHALIKMVVDEKRETVSATLSETVRQFAQWKGPERKR